MTTKIRAGANVRPKPVLLPFQRPQPTPKTTRVAHLKTRSGEMITAVTREWNPGDSGPDGACRLCDSCRAYGDACLIIAGWFVSRVEAPTLSAIGRTWQGYAEGGAP